MNIKVYFFHEHTGTRIYNEHHVKPHQLRSALQSAINEVGDDHGANFVFGQLSKRSCSGASYSNGAFTAGYGYEKPI